MTPIEEKPATLDPQKAARFAQECRKLADKVEDGLMFLRPFVTCEQDGRPGCAMGHLGFGLGLRPEHRRNINDVLANGLSGVLPNRIHVAVGRVVAESDSWGASPALSRALLALADEVEPE